MDVRICSPCDGELPKIEAAARRDGEACARHVRIKRVRYDDTVIPFILEVGGRPCKEAREWVRKLMRDSVLEENKSVMGARAWAGISCTLQRYVAIQLLKAEGKM